MLKSTCTLATFTLLSACAAIPTFGSISKTPMQLANGDLAYRYEGRANYPHQQEVADKMMAEHCMSLSGGAAIVVDAQQSIIGAAAFGSSNASIAGTATGPYQLRSYNAAASTNSSGSALANKQQYITFRCVKR